MIRICPKCNKDIDHLINTTTGALTLYMSTDKQGDLQYETGEFEPDDITDEYQCPECDEVLFTKEEEAIAFLKGE